MRMLWLAFLLASAPCFATASLPDLPPYYPASFRQILTGPIEPGHFRNMLFEVLDRAHVSNHPGPDDLIDDCSSKATCYRQRPLDYRFARQKMFGSLHLAESSSGYAVRDVYCAIDYTEADFPAGSGPYPGRIPSAQVMSTEHTWPQSKFSRSFPKDLQKGDLHILFPTDSGVNSVRSNHPFGEVRKVSQSPCREARKGQSATSGRQVFEPANEHKGNVARALFYFSVRYKIAIDPEQEEVLRRWHQMDPVDEFEAARNDEIFEIQGNRNPFIDRPSMAEMIQDF